jgi:predicted dehydrogenase
VGSRLGVGFVGAGFNTKFHIRSWVGVRHADVVGVTSRTYAHAQQAAKLARDLDVGEAKAYKSLAQMARDPAIQAIWVNAPNYTRVEVIDTIVRARSKKLVGVAVEKPLARNVAEAKQVVAAVKKSGLLHGYLENNVFAPALVRGKDLLWRRGAATAGRPYLARAAEEHGGPHEPWFWRGKDAGGGVLNDMMCHSLEAARFMLQDPAKGPESLRLKTVSAEIGMLKWTRPEYVKRLKAQHGVDYGRHPAEDFARACLTWEDERGNPLVTEATTSWSFVGPGLRLSFEAMGPEYSLAVSTLDSELKIFFSRDVVGKAGEDIVEKQTAEQGLMPVVVDEEMAYGYTGENRHMVDAFRHGRMPAETLDHGLMVTQILMACYMSAELGRRLTWPVAGLDSYVPPVARE